MSLRHCANTNNDKHKVPSLAFFIMMLWRVDCDLYIMFYQMLHPNYYQFLISDNAYCRWKHWNPNLLVTDKVCQWFATGGWFSPGIPVSSMNKTDSHDVKEILLKVTFNTINQSNLFIDSNLPGHFCIQ